MRFFLLCAVVIGVQVSVSAQRVCGSTEYASRMRTFAMPDEPVSQAPLFYRDTLSQEIITIPVVVHILYNQSSQKISEAQVLSQLRVLNEDFRRLNADAAMTPQPFRTRAADARIRFCLAQRDPQNRNTSGILRTYTQKTAFTLDDAMKFTAAGGDNAWDARSYLNIWVCALQNNNLGYATYPGGPVDRDGIVIDYRAFGTTGSLRPGFDKGRTATHEVAHWMGLKHIWGDEDCGDDDVDDTPTQAGYNYHCPSFPHISTCSPDSYGDMFMNFMDYTNDACMNLFTTGQVRLMRGVFSIRGKRNSFLNTFVCEPAEASPGPLPEEDTLPAAPSRPDLTLYPNPVTTYFKLATANGYVLQQTPYQILSAEGRVLQRGLWTSESHSLQVSGLTPGIYLLILGSGVDRRIIKFVKQ